MLIQYEIFQYAVITGAQIVICAALWLYKSKIINAVEKY
ncbi:hypothetical protein IKC_06008 [Bacillus cereus VD184]|uniref:Uncharacterized protein n=1 Tax=Bacillus cereus VD184 TaxID=1053242 RepID=A0A9W5R233_BACCE|nr:hypothetical protein IKC_06008 [Bacillus cereus VD184]